MLGNPSARGDNGKVGDVVVSLLPGAKFTARKILLLGAAKNRAAAAFGLETPAAARIVAASREGPKVGKAPDERLFDVRELRWRKKRTRDPVYAHNVGTSQ